MVIDHPCVSAARYALHRWITMVGTFLAQRLLRFAYRWCEGWFSLRLCASRVRCGAALRRFTCRLQNRGVVLARSHIYSLALALRIDQTVYGILCRAEKSQIHSFVVRHICTSLFSKNSFSFDNNIHCHICQYSHIRIIENIENRTHRLSLCMVGDAADDKL